MELISSYKITIHRQVIDVRKTSCQLIYISNIEYQKTRKLSIIQYLFMLFSCNSLVRNEYPLMNYPCKGTWF